MANNQTERSSEYITLKEYIDTRLSAMDRATEQAYRSMESRLEGMNEFRNTLRDQSGQFVTRTEYKVAHDRILDDLRILRDIASTHVIKTELDVIILRLERDIRSLSESRALLEGKASQSSVNIAYIMSGIGLLIAVIGVVMRFFGA